MGGKTEKSRILSILCQTAHYIRRPQTQAQHLPFNTMYGIIIIKSNKARRKRANKQIPLAIKVSRAHFKSRGELFPNHHFLLFRTLTDLHFFILK